MSVNLHETERLIEDICTLLRTESEAASDSGGERLAARYAEQCRSANLRLRNCGTMIANGDPRAALQLANQLPDLLEWVILLEFFELEDWKQRCKDQRWESGAAINPQDLQALNDAHAKGLPPDDPLVKESLKQLWGRYRTAMMERDYLTALAVLRRISQIDPNDLQVRTQADDMERMALARQMIDLDHLLQNGTPEEVVELVGKLEKSDFRTPPNGRVWFRAQYIRCLLWLKIAQARHAKKYWEAAEQLLAKIRDKQQTYTIQFTPKETAQLGELEGWTESQRKINTTNQEFDEQLSLVRYRLEEGEEALATKVLSLKKLRGLHAGLYKEWRALEQFSMRVDEETIQRYRKLKAMMETAIDQQSSHSLWRKVAAVSTALVVVGGVAWAFLGLLKIKDEDQQLDSLVRSRQVSAAKTRLEKLRANQSNAPQVGILGEAMAKADRFITKEEGVLQAYKARLQSLTNQFVPRSEQVKIRLLEQDLAKLKEDLDSLAPEFKVVEVPVLAAFENQWEQFLQKTNNELNDSFEVGLKSFEADVLGLAFNQSMPDLRDTRLKIFQKGVKLADKKGQVPPKIIIKPTLLQRFDIARQREAEFEKAFQEYGAAIQALNTATDGLAAQKAIQRLADSQLESAVEVQKAKLAGTQLIAPQQSLIPLLSLTEKQVEYLLQEDPDLSFFPADLVQAETDALARLHKRWTLLDEFQTQNKIPKLDFFNKSFQKKGGYSLLQELNYLNEKGAAAPLLCVYFYLEFEEIMQLRPENWGWSFSPTLQRHVSAIKKETGGVRLALGDWNRNEKIQKHEGPFKKLFSEMTTASYQKEAQAHARLRMLALKESLPYVGYVNTAGQPTLSASVAPVELWGHSENGQLRLLFEKKSDTIYLSSKLGLQPLTLLFGSKKSRADLIEESGYNALGTWAKKDLPPFFTITAN